MALFGKKNKDKDKGKERLPFWKRRKKPENEPIISERVPDEIVVNDEQDEFEEIAVSVIQEHSEKEKEEIARAKQEAEETVALDQTRQEAIALARAAALTATTEQEEKSYFDLDEENEDEDDYFTRDEFVIEEKAEEPENEEPEAETPEEEGIESSAAGDRESEEEEPEAPVASDEESDHREKAASFTESEIASAHAPEIIVEDAPEILVEDEPSAAENQSAPMEDMPQAAEEQPETFADRYAIEDDAAAKEAPAEEPDSDEAAAQADELPEEDAAEASEEEAADTESEPAPEKRKSLFERIREGLRRTKDAMMSRLSKLLGSFTKIDDDLFEELEETLIVSDLGPETSIQIVDTLRERVKERGITDPQEIMGMIQEIITEMLGEDEELIYPTTPTVVMVIGVNGAGKTTTIGKLSHQLNAQGKKVLVAAADTFRAAAIDQLAVWTERAGVDLIRHAEGSDPASVVYDALEAAIARRSDVLIIDTAGRLHNKKNLMQELAKINRIVEQKAQNCHKEILLVLDATTGQNAVNQAKLFSEVADIGGIVLTKLDGTAKGGIIVSIRNELGIPVKLVGVGEKIDDLQPFRGADFVRALFTA